MSAFELPSSSESSCSDADTEPEWVDGTSVPQGKRGEGKCTSGNQRNSQAVASVEEKESSKQRKGREITKRIGKDEKRTLGCGLGDIESDACAIKAVKQRETRVIRGRSNRESDDKRKQFKGGGIVPIKRGGPIALSVPPDIKESFSSKSNIGYVRLFWYVSNLIQS